MPLQVKKVQLKVKDGNQYVDGDMLFNVDAEAWARGKRNGQTVPSTDPTYHNNAEYFAQQAATSAAAADQIVFTGNLAPSYSSSAAYQIGDYVVYNNALYECTTAIPSSGEAFNVSHWQAVMVSDIKEQVDNIIVVNEQAQPETKVQIETTDEDVDIALMSDLTAAVSSEQARATAAENLKVNKPINSPNGTNGQLLRTLGDGNTEWVDQGTPTYDQVHDVVEELLEENPSWRANVQDGTLTEAKFTDELKLKTIKDYVTPEMYGAVGDGVADDADAINLAVATGKVVLLTQKYKINSPINIINNTRIYGDKIGKRYDQPIDTTCIISSGIFFHSETSISKCQLLDISLMDTSSDDSGNKVFDCNLERCDFRINGYKIHKFTERMQACVFEGCTFVSTIGTFASYCSDSKFLNCYISGKTASENPFIDGTVSALIVDCCYFDFWHFVFKPTTSSSHNIVSNNIFDACYRVFSGKYDYFGVVNNVFMRIFDSALWSLSQNDWAVFSNGLRNYTRSIGNRVDADYYIHTSLTGNNYPNTGSYSGWNSISPRTQIKWNPYPNDSTDLLNTRIEELNYKTYDSLQNASLTAGSSERFNHQIVFVNNVCYINNNGTWIQLSN